MTDANASAPNPALSLLIAARFLAGGEVEIQPVAKVEAGTSSGVDAGTNLIGPAGPQGRQGIQGIQGETGPPGQDAKVVTEVYAFTGASTWLVAHNLGRWPSVTAVDTANEEIRGDLLYVDNNVLQMTFAIPVSGFLYVN